MKKKINWKILIWSFVVVFIIAFLGSIFTSKNVNSDWYESIKPSITPPSFVFPIAWNILFILIAISLYFVWSNSKKNEKGNIILVYGFNFVANVFWSVFYFGVKEVRLAFYDILFVWVSIICMIILAFRIDKKAAWLLVPYLLWVSFASVLNYLSAFS